MKALEVTKLRRSTLAIAIVLIGSALAPVAAANHFSMGGDAALITEPEETRTDPTVPPERYDVGTTDPDDCVQTAEDPATAAGQISEDEFCGDLHYGEDLGGFGQVSSPDQDIPLNGLTWGTEDHPINNVQFDVVRINEQGTGLACSSYCFAITEPVIKEAYLAAWPALNTAGLANDGAEESYNADGGSISISPTVGYPNAGYLLQTQSPVDWDMNGWASPDALYGWIAFFTADLADANGHWVADKYVDETGPEDISDEVLTALVKGEDPDGDGTLDIDLDGDNKIDQGLIADGVLPDSAVDTVCLFSTEVGFTSAGGACHFGFTWTTEGGRQATDGYNDADYGNPCTSPTYYCGERGIWNTNRQGTGVTTPDGGNDGDPDRGSTTEYEVFHFVAAPTPSQCQQSQEPGFLFQPPAGSDHPYLAHDLDVHSSVTTAAGVRGTGFTSEAVLNLPDQIQDTADEAVDRTTEQAEQAVEGITPQAVSDTLDTVDDASYAVAKDDRTEPDIPGDNSQSLYDAERASSDGSDLVRSLTREDCDIFRDTEQTVEPWVAYMDTTLFAGHGSIAGFSGTGIYGNTAQHQDEANNPGPAVFYRDGNLGMFTDVDDSGGYDTAPIDTHFADAESYPLFWGLRATTDESGEIVIDTEGSGCNYGFFDDPPPLSSEMAQAGYGLHTALYDVVYLQEPSVWHSFASNQDVVPFLEGGAFVMMNNPPQVILEEGTQTQKAIVQQQIQVLLNQLAANGAPQLTFSLDDSVDDGVELMYEYHDVREDFAISDQCTGATGAYEAQWFFSHDCSALDCTNDAAATGYFLDLAGETDTNRDDVTIGSGQRFQDFDPDGDGVPFNFDSWQPPAGGVGTDASKTGTGFHLIDVDPLDNNPDDHALENAAPCTPAQAEGERIECAEQVTGVTATGTAGDSVTVSWDPVKEEAEEDAAPHIGEVTYVVERVATAQGGDTYKATFQAQDAGSVTDSFSDVPDGTVFETVEYTVSGQYEYANIDVPPRLGIASEIVSPS